MMRKRQPTATMPMIAVILLLLAGSAGSTGLYGNESLEGEYVIAADGGFVAMTPFAPNPLRLNVAMVGRLTFDGNGLVHGHWTISFHNAVVPFGVRSRFETTGSYQVATDGHMFMELEEFKVEPPASDDGVADGVVGFECYVVKRQREARCILNTLISLGQGPDPVPEPVTMPGTLLRQN